MRSSRRTRSRLANDNRDRVGGSIDNIEPWESDDDIKDEEIL